MNAASNIDKFHFIKGNIISLFSYSLDSKLPALNPRKYEEIQINKEISEIIQEEEQKNEEDN